MQRRLVLFIISALLTAAIAGNGAGPQAPSFVIFAHGLWGSMDRIPGNNEVWLAASPYPHYCKHDRLPYLSGPDYQPIPQAYLKLAEGPSLGKLVIHPYWMMQHEFKYWADRLNKSAGREEVKIFHDWQRDMHPGAAGRINLVYLKYDWRLGLPEVTKYYFTPFLDYLDEHWPGAEINFIGHSLGGLVGRYVAAVYPGRLASLVTVGAPHYGLAEVGMQRRGEKSTYGGQDDMEFAQAFGLWLTERIFFKTKIIKLGRDFLPSAVEFTKAYTPMADWLDPAENLLVDGFNGLTPLAAAVPRAVAIYGLGFGSYDLEGRYHYEMMESRQIGPGLGPEGPPGYAECGDGRVDPFSARGPFTNTLCIGKEVSHGDLMWSPLVMTSLLDWFFFDAEMPVKAMRRALRRLGVEWVCDLRQRLDWLSQARTMWNSLPADLPAAAAGDS